MPLKSEEILKKIKSGYFTTTEHIAENDPQFDKRSQKSIKSNLILFAILVILVTWGVLIEQMKKSEKALLDRMVSEQANLTSVLSENLFQIMGQKQAIALLAMKWLANHEKNSLDDIKAFLYGDRTFTRVVLYHLNGDLFYESSPLIESQKREEQIKHEISLVAATKTVRFLLPEKKGSERWWQLNFLFPLIHQNRAVGAMLLEMDMGYLLTLFQNIDLGKTGKIMIFSDQGHALAAFENGGLSSNTHLPKQALEDLSLGRSGAGIYTDARYNRYHLTYLKVRNYPIIVTVGQSVDEFLFKYHRHKKRMIWVLVTLSILSLSALGYIIKMVNRTHDYLVALADSSKKNQELIEKLEQEHELSTKAASFDALTDLYNRSLFKSLANQNLLQAKRNRLSYALLFIDLDRFKTINDTLGHQVGDLLLQTVARRIKSCIRASDIAARFGGDEFVIMLNQVPNEKDIAAIAEKLIREISKPCENLDGHRVRTSPSIGIAIYPRDGDHIDALILSADAAMYKSKESGRGKYSFFDTALNTVSIEQFELEQQMPGAIAGDEFMLHYQPKIRLEDYRVVGLESLIRWQHTDDALIFPGDFIEIAEKTGLIVDLGRWVLQRACRQLQEWKSEGLALLPIAVNVSPLELKDERYALHFLTILDQYGIAPEWIEVEITENALIEKREIVVENLKTLHDRGVKISLDDFGKGFSSLDHIRSLPISTIKIDRSFIQEIRNAHHDNPIVSSTIILAKKLKLTVVAEGIETHDQLVNLKVAGCDQVQGYYFSRPVPENEIREFIKSPKRSLAA